MYYPPAIREDAPSSSEAEDAPEEIEAADPDAALAITSSKEPAKESDPSGAVETDEGQNPDAALAITSSKEPAKESDPSGDRKSTRLNSSHERRSRMPSSA